MAGRYGMTFAAKLIEQGKYAEAVEEASRAVARDDEDPAALVDRATAYAWLERYPEAVRDFEAALQLDAEAGVLEIDLVDDAYFSAVLGAAQAEAKTSIEAAERTLARYEAHLPAGRHLDDAAVCGPSGCARRAPGSGRKPPVASQSSPGGHVNVIEFSGYDGESRRSRFKSAAPA